MDRYSGQSSGQNGEGCINAGVGDEVQVLQCSKAVIIWLFLPGNIHLPSHLPLQLCSTPGHVGSISPLKASYSDTSASPFSSKHRLLGMRD